MNEIFRVTAVKVLLVVLNPLPSKAVWWCPRLVLLGDALGLRIQV